MLLWSTVKGGRHTMNIYDIVRSKVRMGLCGMAGKDAARHQRRVTSHCEVRCYKALLNVLLLRR